jgi:hypothetical protein
MYQTIYYLLKIYTLFKFIATKIWEFVTSCTRYDIMIKQIINFFLRMINGFPGVFEILRLQELRVTLLMQN